MRCMPTGLVFLMLLGPKPALADRGSHDLSHARDGSSMDRRDREIIAGFVRGFADEETRCLPQPWPPQVGKDPLASANLQIARLAAVAYMLAYPSDFAPGALGYDVNNHINVGGDSDGYYVVMARLRKDGAGNISKWWHWNYRRGILEVVPGSLYPSLDALEAELRAWHRPEFGYLSAGDHDDNRPYRYVTMTSHERLTLDPKMGADPKIGVLNETYTYPKYYRSYCRDGIRSVETLVDPGSGPAGSNLDYRWMEIDRGELYIPKKIRKNKQRKNIPLARVWELNERYEHTGRMLMEELDRGRLAIRRVDWNQVGTGGSGPILIPIWDCLLVDSHDHTQPKEDEQVALDYRDCWAEGFEAHLVRSVAVGSRSTCAVHEDDEIWCWGENTHGQLGDPAAPDQSANAIQVLGLDPERMFLARGSGSHVCAVDEAREIQCWGSHSEGQLGTGAAADSLPHHLPEAVAWP